MTWQKITPWLMQDGAWTMTWAPNVPYPYGLWHDGVMIGHYRTHQEAARAADAGPSAASSAAVATNTNTNRGALDETA